MEDRPIGVGIVGSAQAALVTLPVGSVSGSVQKSGGVLALSRELGV